MSIATATRKRKRRLRKRLNRGGMIRQNVTEYAAIGNVGSVDREAGVIHGVKILGRVSKNGRTYSQQAMQDAGRLYEGVSVNIDHPARPGEERHANDRFGRLKNIKVTEDGVFGDLEYLKTHPMADRITEAAERMPDQYGLSHNVEAQLERIDGKTIVQRIDSVRSVDLVSDPATTQGLFESVSMTTFKQLVESIPAKTVGRKCLLELLGDETLGDVVADEPVVADVDDSSSEEQIKVAFDTAAVAVVKDESIGPADTAKKVEMLMSAKEEALGGTEPDVPLEEEEDDEEGKKKTVAEELHGKEKKKTVAEESHKRSINTKLSQLQETVDSITEENDALKAKDHARELLESNNREVDDVRLVAVVALPNDKLRRQLVESWPKAQQTDGAPRPKTSVPLMEDDRDTKFEDDPEKFCRLLRA